MTAAREGERRCLLDRSSRPHRSPRLLAAELQRADLRLPPRDRLGAAPGRGRDRLRALDRLEGAPSGRDLAARRRPVREPANRYEWPCPGDLLHMDVSSLRALPAARPPRHRRPLTALTRLDSVETRVGYDYAHAIVDDHTRLAYVELHDDERAATVTGFLERALAFFAEHGIIAKRLMTDNGFSYVKNRSLRELLARHGIRHLTDRALPATHQRQSRALPPNDGPRMGLRPPLPLTSTPRPAALPHWLNHYNTTTAAQLTRRPAPDQPRSQRP